MACTNGLAIGYWLAHDYEPRWLCANAECIVFGSRQWAVCVNALVISLTIHLLG